MDTYFQDPAQAAFIAAAIVILYVYGTNKMNGSTKIKNSDYFKPAFLVGILVFFIVKQAQGVNGSKTLDPF
jgi:hypothetical protein